MADPKDQSHEGGGVKIDVDDTAAPTSSSTNDHKPRNAEGWDGKLRVGELLSGSRRQAVLANPEALSDPDYSDPEQTLPGEVIDADEGTFAKLHGYRRFKNA